MIKNKIKSILPSSFIVFLRNQKRRRDVMKSYKYDAKRYYRYSATKGFSDETKLTGEIIKNYHVVEKGLTMPDSRLGFGQNKVLLLCNDCKMYYSRYNKLEKQIAHAISVLLEYKKFNEQGNYKLSKEVENALNDIEELARLNRVNKCAQTSITKENYFKDAHSAFDKFSKSRKSVRNYTSENIPMEKLSDVVKLALNTPSACNRQTSRVYIYDNKKEIADILNIQNGSRGFGHLANKLLVITAELGVFANAFERNQAYIDGGIFAMNLLYSLHFHEIAACILNCSSDYKKDIALRNICKVKDSEVLIAMIVCGIPPEEFSIALSQRYDAQEISNIETN